MSIRDLGTRKLPRPIGVEPIKRQASSPELVRRQEVPLWQERGWTRNGTTFVGSYQTQYGAFQGEIESRSGWFSGRLRFYIDNPPRQVFQSSHGPCFQPVGNGRFEVHMSTMPRDESSGILTIERLLTEAIENH
jgi:hypothetical protein